MFTIGIFTTHIPYIAFVVFYAYFLIFGVEKTSRGEIELVDSKHKIEIQANDLFVSADTNENYSYKSDFYFYSHTDFYALVFKRQLKHQILVSSENWQFKYCTTLFNRPPPFTV